MEHNVELPGDAKVDCQGIFPALVKIKDGYYIKHIFDYENTDYLTLHCCSKNDFKSSAKIARKYLGTVSSRAYYPAGNKKWFSQFAYHYEFLIHKSLLEVDPEKTSLAYLYYRLGQMEVGTNAHGYTNVDGNRILHQYGDIHYSKWMSARDFREISKHAVSVSEMITESATPFQLDFDPVKLLLIEKYAQRQTNYSKTYKNYSLYHPQNLHELMKAILASSDTLSPETISYWKAIVAANPSDVMASNILSDFLCWNELYRGKDFRNIPQEIYDAFLNVRSWADDNARLKRSFAMRARRGSEVPR